MYSKEIVGKTDQIDNREHLYLKCNNSVKVLQETSEAMGIEINDMETKGYEVLIYKKKENVWEETRENLFLLLYRFYIFNCSWKKSTLNKPI